MFNNLKQNSGKFLYKNSKVEISSQISEKPIKPVIEVLSKPQLVGALTEKIQRDLSEGGMEINDPEILLNREDPKKLSAKIKEKLSLYFNSISRNPQEADKKMAAVKSNQVEELALKFALFIENEKKREEEVGKARDRILAYIAQNKEIISQYKFELNRRKGEKPMKEWPVEIKENFNAYCKLVDDVETLLGKTKSKIEALHGEIAGLKQPETPTAQQVNEKLENLRKEDQGKLVLKTNDGFIEITTVNNDYFINGKPVSFAQVKREVLDRVKSGEIKNIRGEDRLDSYNDRAIV